MAHLVGKPQLRSLRERGRIVVSLFRSRPAFTGYLRGAVRIRQPLRLTTQRSKFLPAHPRGLVPDTHCNRVYV